MTLVSPQVQMIVPEPPDLTPELVAHLFDCFDHMPPAMHPIILETGINAAIRSVSFRLSLLSPELRVLAMSMIALAARVSFHEAILGPGPRPESFSDTDFFSSQTEACNCGVRRAEACHAIQAAALAAAWDIGVMLKVSYENTASCFMLDLLQTSALWWSGGPSRPWAAGYYSHLRALAPIWMTSPVAPRYTYHWAAFFASIAFFAGCVFSLQIRLTHEDHLLFCGAEPPSAEELLMSLEASAERPGAGILFRAMMPYAFHVTRLCRILWRTITGDHARLRPLSESAVLQFLSSLSLIQAILSHLLARADAILTDERPQKISFVLETATEDGILRGCVYLLVIGFTGLVLPLYRELELRAATDIEDPQPHAHARRERLQLLMAQTRDMVELAVRALLRMIRRLPRVMHVPFPGMVDYAEFALEQAEANPFIDPERVRDLATIAGQVKMMGYSFNIHLAVGEMQSTAALLDRLNQYVDRATQPVVQSFQSESDPLADFLRSIDPTLLNPEPD
ncbi:Zn(2)-C6 fungal-type domain-containing protein [Mycena venus]|uniref:Zn(2)-C6 fungal-type domain-containing protein n=1 Tax=Mycena venus TaxID=2733690 RepID=A0A8H6Z193_9AGAR|nr:Zn(2)-C6 fungal-type domain-containing protein [Mycena venus]